MARKPIDDEVLPELDGSVSFSIPSCPVSFVLISDNNNTYCMISCDAVYVVCHLSGGFGSAHALSSQAEDGDG
jgi:hypothetical protein